MPKDEWGVKRLCAACGARFYDLGRDPVDCPKCGETFSLAAVLAAKGKVSPATAKKPAAADDEELDDDDEDEAVVEDDDAADDDAEDVAADETVLDADDDDDDDEADEVLLADDDDDDDDDGLGDFNVAKDDEET